MKNVFVCEFLQESNAFNPTLTSFEDFSSSGICEGEELVHSNGKAGVTVQAMLDVLSSRGLQAVGGVRMRSKSGGPVDHNVVDWFVEKTLTALKAVDQLAGVSISLHGATQSDTSVDVCGDILAAIRETVGETVKIAVALDLHANITQKMARAADFICGYRTYPHLDFYETGYRAASFLADALDGRSAQTAWVSVPMIAPAHGYTTAAGGLKKLMDYGYSLAENGTILDFTVFHAQPWLDASEFGAAVLVTAQDGAVAGEIASEMAQMLFELRQELQGPPLWSIEEVIQAAMDNGEDKPVILVDSADSPNAGACGDSADVLEKVLPYRNSLRTAFSLNDAAAVEKAFQLGVGACADFTMGASIAPELSRPVKVPNATVRSLHDGTFRLGGPAERGQLRHMGRSAVLQAGEISILVTQRGQNNGDLQFYRGFGIEPTLCRLVDVKACSSFRAGYEPISAKICNTATLGAAGTVLSRLPYRKRPEKFYPFREIEKEQISKAAYLGDRR